MFAGNSIRGTYIIGVYGFSPCSFTIRVTQNPKNVKKLISGIPEHNTIKALDIDYYYYQSSIKQNILIKITPLYGKTIIYANTQILYTDELYEQLPSASFYIWSSVEGIGPHSLMIPSSSAKFCVSCNIVIGVYAVSNSSYSISAMHDMNISLLENGIPQRSEIAKEN